MKKSNHPARREIGSALGLTESQLKSTEIRWQTHSPNGWSISFMIHPDARGQIAETVILHWSFDSVTIPFARI